MKCVPGCKHFTGGEIKHDRNCPFYGDSLSRKYDEIESFLKIVLLAWNDDGATDKNRKILDRGLLKMGLCKIK